MSPRDKFTHEEAVLLAKALAKAQEEISRLEDMLEDANATKDLYRDYWVEECQKTKGLEADLAKHSAPND
jgi:hypothetical protein